MIENFDPSPLDYAIDAMTLDAIRSVDAADIDSDGDIDFLTASSGNGGKIIWFENDGSENFSARTVANT